MDFEQIGIIRTLLKALDRQGFTHPTDIQEKVLPLALEGKDILGSAQTGSGKTLAFSLPIIQKMYEWKHKKGIAEGDDIKRNIQALIIAPTRELAIQIGDAIQPYCTNTNFKHTVIYGGKNQFHQVKAIKKGIDILIATPGRLEDLVSQGVMKLSQVEYLVLDEADRMLDLGFLPNIKKVMKQIPKGRQTFLFSATMPVRIRELAREVLDSPEEITVNAVSSTVDTIEEQVYHIKSTHRRKLLQQIVKREDLESIIVFVKTKDDTKYVLEYVQAVGITAENISRDKSQNARQRALKALKTGEVKVLVATDIASRGLDVNNLSCVVNYSLPSDPESYVHRVGRTGRAGKSGLAISMCIHQEKDRIEEIEKLTGSKISIIEDQSYLEETIPAGDILGKKNFQENWKDKNKQKKKEEFAVRMKFYKKLKERKKEKKANGTFKKKKKGGKR